MDLELSDEQVWIEESINTLLDRQWPAAQDAWQAGEAMSTISIEIPRWRGTESSVRANRPHFVAY